jgi:hypothetical protein
MMGAEMWVIVLLLVVYFALFLLSRMAKTERARMVFRWSGVVVASIALYLAVENDCLSYVVDVIVIQVVCMAIFDLIAAQVSRRKVMSPCVRVKIPRSGDGKIIELALVVFLIVFVISPLVMYDNDRSYWLNVLLMAPFVLAMIICIIVFRVVPRFKRAEICANGLWMDGKLQLWNEYESFVWTEQEDGVELRLVPNPLPGCVTRLVVAPKHREAARQILVANLPDMSVVKENQIP